MANPILLKYSSVTSAVPTAGALTLRELAINTTDGRLFTKTVAGVVVEFARKDETLNVTTITATTHAPTAIYGRAVILCNTNTNTITVTLPTAINNNALFSIKKTAAANNMVINTTLSQTIDDSTSITVTTQNESLTIVSDGSNWKVI